MSEPHEPDAAALARLWQSARAHAVPAERVGEYAAIRQRRGATAAGSAYPDVAEHLARACRTCAEELHEIEALLMAERTRELGVRVGRIALDIGGPWLVTFARGLRFARQPIGHGPGDPAEEATTEHAPADAEPPPPPPWAELDEPAVITLELDVEGTTGLVVEASPYGDGCAIRLRPSNRDPDSVQDLANWQVRFEGADRPEPATVRTNGSGAAVFADVAFDDLLGGRLTLLPPGRTS